MENIVVGLDIGTTKVCAIVASVNEHNEINILGVGKAPSDGLNRGVVVNIDKTVQAIRTAIEQAELASGIKVRAVNVGIAGDHIRSLRSKGVITITNRDSEITSADVNRLLEDCQRIMLPNDQQIIHVIPQEFIVDGQDGIADPIGMSGRRLEADVHIITGLVSAAKNLYRCVERAGYQVQDLILEPLASSYAVLAEEERQAGVVLVDIGGGTTDIAVFQDNIIRHTAVIGIAGQKVTDDIKIGLGVLEDQALRLKHEYGVSHPELIKEDEIIVVPGIAGRPPKEIRRSVLCEIIHARVEEILEFAAIEIKRSGYQSQIGAGVVFTGGGALVEGINLVAQEVMGMESKVGYPRGLDGGMVSEVNNPIYATGIGLVMHAIKSKTTMATAEVEESASSNPFDKTAIAAKAASVADKIKKIFLEF